MYDIGTIMENGNTFNGWENIRKLKGHPRYIVHYVS